MFFYLADAAVQLKVSGINLNLIWALVATLALGIAVAQLLSFLPGFGDFAWVDPVVVFCVSLLFGYWIFQYHYLPHGYFLINWSLA